MTDRHIADPRSLSGRWTLSRTINDRLADEQSTVTGFTELTVINDEHITWHETGTLLRGAQELPVQRTLNVVVRDAQWIVTFDDGRYFHPWLPGTVVEHPCGADHYVGTIEVGPEPVTEWTVQWDVTGPHKNYTMKSLLTAYYPLPN